MKVIFLDFDGVLNSPQYLRSCCEGLAIDPAKMALFKELVDTTGARIVLTTSWREHWSDHTAECSDIGTKINSIFEANGMQIFSKTPELGGRREWEIKSWLAEHPEVISYVVLDDMLLSDDALNDHYVKISSYFGGLDETDVQNAIKILTDKDVPL